MITIKRWEFALVLVAVAANHCVLNLTVDYFDYRYAVDHRSGGPRNHFSEGSGVLPAGFLKSGRVLNKVMGCFALDGHRPYPDYPLRLARFGPGRDRHGLIVVPQVTAHLFQPLGLRGDGLLNMGSILVRTPISCRRER